MKEREKERQKLRQKQTDRQRSVGKTEREKNPNHKPFHTAQQTPESKHDTTPPATGKSKSRQIKKPKGQVYLAPDSKGTIDHRADITVKPLEGRAYLSS